LKKTFQRRCEKDKTVKEGERPPWKGVEDKNLFIMQGGSRGGGGWNREGPADEKDR